MDLATYSHPHDNGCFHYAKHLGKKYSGMALVSSFNVIARIIYSLEKSDSFIEGFYCDPSPSTWRKIFGLQQGKRSTGGKYKVINCGWA